VKLSPGEELLMLQIRLHKLPAPTREYRFCNRRWRFDFAWPGLDQMVAIEVEGGIWSKGRHTRGCGFEADASKYNQAALDGWKVGRFTTGMVERMEAIAWLRKALSDGGN